MLSIPRDLYVENDQVGWGTRVNSIYEYVYEDTQSKTLAIAALKDQIEEIAGIPIHYYAKIDFQGFVDVVDALNGIEITVEERIYDATYPAKPNSGKIYDPFLIEEGTQKLDGETALKYARSRHTSSDFGRAARQQQIIAAAKDKALSLGVLLNPTRIRSLVEAISDNFETNLSTSEMIYIGGKANLFNQEDIQSAVISDDPNQMGGYLYPGDRELYGGAAVLVPYVEDFSQIQDFTRLYFYNPEIYTNPPSLQVLNGTKTGNLAFFTKMYLERMGLTVTRFGNAAEKGVLETSIFTQDKSQIDPLASETDWSEAMDQISKLILGDVLSEAPALYTPELWESDADIIIEIGEDFANYFLANPDQFLSNIY